MKSKFKKGITTVLATTTLFVSIFQAAVSVRADMNDIQNFVRSLYVDCLGRQPDQIGFDYWCSRLQSGEITGKQCAYGFFFSTEFTSKANSLNDTDYINTFYNVFLNRGYDSTGLAYWNDKISDTVYDTTVLFTGFADSVEFANKCSNYGILSGSHISVPYVVRTTIPGGCSLSGESDPIASGGGVSSGDSSAPSVPSSDVSSDSIGSQSSVSINPQASASNNNTGTSFNTYSVRPSGGSNTPYNYGNPIIVPMTPTPTPVSVVYSEPASINTTNITLVVADERRTQEFTPEFASAYAANKVDSFQLVVSNANSISYSVISGTAEVSSTGLVTPGRDVWGTEDGSLWVSNPRHTVSENAIETRIDYFPGESVIRVTADGQTFDVTVTVIDFADQYTNEVLEQFIAENNLRSEDMSVEEKAYLITQYVAHNYNYSIYYGGSADMVTHGCGDCVGSMNLIHRICGMVGLTCRGRDARSDWGAGSGHVNAVIFDEENGMYYVCDAGTSGTAPRAFMVGATDTLPVGTYNN